MLFLKAAMVLKILDSCHVILKSKFMSPPIICPLINFSSYLRK